MTVRSLVVLAAGNGSRFGGPKQFHLFAPLNLTLLEYNLKNGIAIGINHLVIICRAMHKEYIDALITRLPNDIKVDIAIQDNTNLPDNCLVTATREKPLGTAHALWCAKPYLTGDFIVINGDDYYGPSAFSLSQKVGHNWVLMVAFLAGNTLSQNGGVNRGICQTKYQQLIAIEEVYSIEQKGSDLIGLDKENKQITIEKSQLVSMNFWCFSCDIFSAIEKVLLDTFSNTSMQEQEALLPDAVAIIISQQPEKTRVETSHDAWFGVTYSADCLYVEQALKQQF